MAGRTDTDHGLVPVKSRVSLSSRPVPPSYNKGREPDLTKQDLYNIFLRRCKLRVKSVVVNYDTSSFSFISFLYHHFSPLSHLSKVVSASSLLKRLKT